MNRYRVVKEIDGETMYVGKMRYKNWTTEEHARYWYQYSSAANVAIQLKARVETVVFDIKVLKVRDFSK